MIRFFCTPVGPSGMGSGNFFLLTLLFFLLTALFQYDQRLIKFLMNFFIQACTFVVCFNFLLTVLSECDQRLNEILKNVFIEVCTFVVCYNFLNNYISRFYLPIVT